MTNKAAIDNQYTQYPAQWRSSNFSTSMWQTYSWHEKHQWLLCVYIKYKIKINDGQSVVLLVNRTRENRSWEWDWRLRWKTATNSCHLMKMDWWMVKHVKSTPWRNFFFCSSVLFCYSVLSLLFMSLSHRYYSRWVSQSFLSSTIYIYIRMAHTHTHTVHVYIYMRQRWTIFHRRKTYRTPI